MTGFDTQQAGFILGALCRVAMAAILAQSAWHALGDQPAFQAAVAGYRLLPAWLIMPAAWALPLLNLAACPLLLVPATAAVGAMLATALVAVFALAILINVRRGRLHIECGCGGARGQAISPGLVVRNAALLGLLAVAGMAPRQGVLDGAAFVAVVAGACATASLYFVASQLLANKAAVRAAGARA